MIEALAVGARALGVLASAHLIGVPLFLALAGSSPALADWNRHLRTTLPPAAVGLLLALCVALLTQAASVGGSLSAGAELVSSLARDSAYGRIWIWRTALAVALVMATLLALFWLRALPVVVVLAAPATALAALSGHASGTEDAALLIALHMLHAVALSAWFGGLLPWIALARHAAADADLADVVATTLRRFSILAATCVALIVLSGAVLAWEFIDDQGDLLGTRYGLLLCCKLVLLAGVLWIANRVRTRWVPRLTVSKVPFSEGSRQVMREATLALGVLALGSWLAQTTPAIHDQPRWWLPFRLSFNARLENPASEQAIWIGLAGLAAALIVFALTKRRVTSVVLAAAGIAGTLWGLSVRAYPDTFARSPVPYITVSIAQGRTSFEAHCVGCHGAGGLGDGALAPSLPQRPANLSEPHTALHTPGDLYGWFTHGIADSPMPGFAQVLDEEQRWDLVNFLTVFSQGFQARLLGPQIVPKQPWLGAPNFYFATAEGGRAELKDLRRQRAVLLVFPDAGDPRSAPRLAEARGLESEELAVIAPEEPDVWTAYAFLTRTRAHRGAPDALGMPRRHVEFLIDPFGYIRARWVPVDEPAAWDSRFEVNRLVQLLAQESEVRPPPDLHPH